MTDTSPTPVDLDALEHDIFIHGAAISRQLRSRLSALIAELRTCRLHLAAANSETLPDSQPRASIGPDSERIRELEAEVAKYKGALDEIDRMNPDDFRTGQGHLSPAFREVNFRAAFAHVCRIVNRTLHGIDSTEGPSR